MGTTKKDIFKYPVFQYVNGRLIRIYPNNAFHNIFEIDLTVLWITQYLKDLIIHLIYS